jgi:hypothetical protein
MGEPVCRVSAEAGCAARVEADRVARVDADSVACAEADCAKVDGGRRSVVADNAMTARAMTNRAGVRMGSREDRVDRCGSPKTRTVLAPGQPD